MEVTNLLSHFGRVCSGMYGYAQSGCQIMIQFIPRNELGYQVVFFACGFKPMLELEVF